MRPTSETVTDGPVSREQTPASVGRPPGERSRGIADAIARVAATPIGLFFIISAVFFVTEFLVMHFLLHHLVSHENDLESIIDAGIMVSFSAPYLWWLIARQHREHKVLTESEANLLKLTKELEASHSTLETLNQTLEQRVRERTRDLQAREQDLILSNEELKQRNCQLLDARSQAATDALTSLPNHRAFQGRIRAEVRRAATGGSSVGLIMLDIDGFKRFNDSLGHVAGDDLLRRCSHVFVKTLGADCAYRYGGDEFAVILLGADEQQTADVAERLRCAVAGEIDGNNLGITVSLGVAAFPLTAASAEELIYKADAAMYWAKSAGKNRVARWDHGAGDHFRSSAPAEVAVHQG